MKRNINSQQARSRRLLAAKQFQQPSPTATARKTPPARSTAATGPVQALLDNPIIQTLLEELRDGAEVEVQNDTIKPS